MVNKLIAFNKPYGVICQFSSQNNCSTLKDFIKVKNFYAAGRLDKDSEGLLLLTNDGKLQSKITNPKNKIYKTYLAQVDGTPELDSLYRFKNGLQIDDYITQKAYVNIINYPNIWDRIPCIRYRKSIPTTWVKIKIFEGKNRQIRKMCAKINHPCLRLIRISIGNINLLDLKLKIGMWKYIDSNNL